MSGRGRSGLGLGGAVGLGVAAALLVTVIAALHALAAQLEGAARVVIVFAEAAACVILGAVALGALAVLAYRVQLARYHLAERRLDLEAQARQLGAVRAEVITPGADGEALEGGTGALRPTRARPALPGARPSSVLGHTTRRLEAVPDPGDGEGAS